MKMLIFGRSHFLSDPDPGSAKKMFLKRRQPLQGVIGLTFLQILLKVYFLLHFGLYSKYSLYEKTLQNI